MLLRAQALNPPVLGGKLIEANWLDKFCFIITYFEPNLSYFITLVTVVNSVQGLQHQILKFREENIVWIMHIFGIAYRGGGVKFDWKEGQRTFEKIV